MYFLAWPTLCITFRVFMIILLPETSSDWFIYTLFSNFLNMLNIKCICIISWLVNEVVFHPTETFMNLSFILQKLNRKLHLSKVKHSKFNESGQLVTFYLFSIFWGMDIMMKVSLKQCCGLVNKCPSMYRILNLPELKRG